MFGGRRRRSWCSWRSCCAIRRPAGPVVDRHPARPVGIRERSLSRYGLEIRAAVAADAPALSELLRAGGYVASPRSLGERLDALRHEPGTVLLAGEWGPPSGLVMLHWYRTLASDQPVAQITALLVAPDDRRRGIGRLLVKAAAQAARVAGCGALELLAPPEQPLLTAFCLATGFVEAGGRFNRALRKAA